MVCLLFQSYGSDVIAKELVYCLNSFWQHHRSADYKILIYTDNTTFFNQHLLDDSIAFRLVSDDEIKEWRGPKDFIHRVKVKVILDAFEKFNPEKLVYLDTDTFFESSIEKEISRIDHKNTIMHTNEGFLNRPINPIFKKISKFLKTTPILTKGTLKRIPTNIPMWNAGVLGLHCSHKHLVEEVLAMSDFMFDLYQKHVMEQLSFSFVLNQNTKVSKISDKIYHYWAEKEYFRTKINNWLEGQKLEIGQFHVVPMRDNIEIPPKKLQEKNFIQNLTAKLKVY
ncbi:MAG: hypothetical protein SNJ77_05360 [Cytophagales bacterium]